MGNRGSIGVALRFSSLPTPTTASANQLGTGRRKLPKEVEDLPTRGRGVLSTVR
jgi:hypothetical protein